MNINIDDVTEESLCLNLVWLSNSVSKSDIQIGFRRMWRSTLASNLRPWIHVGDNVYLLMSPSHWSPGDISGYLKTSRLDSADEVMVVRTDPDSYIPHQGMNSENFRQIVDEWIEQFKQIGRKR